MGKILDDFMEKHGLDDGLVLAMISDACIQIVDPEFAYNYNKKQDLPDTLKEEAKKIIPEAAFVSSIMALMGGAE